MNNPKKSNKTNSLPTSSKPSKPTNKNSPNTT